MTAPTPNAANPKRRWYQFSLRTLLIVVTLAGCGFAWLGVKVRQAHRQAVEVAAIEKLGGRVTYDYQYDSRGDRTSNVTIPGPSWLHALLGADLCRNVCEVDFTSTPVTPADLQPLKSFKTLKWLLLRSTEMTDSDLEQLEVFSQLEGLWLDHTRVTDAGLAHLSGLSRLRVLSLPATQVTDAGLVYLKGMTHLQELWLSGTRLTDAGLVHLAQLTQLEDLRLVDTQVTDSGLEHLKGLTRLRRLDLRLTKVTVAGVAKLQKALPGCEISPSENR